MSSITAADLKLGGRLVAACDADKKARRREQNQKYRAAYLKKHGISRGQHYYATNKEKAKESGRRWHSQNKERAHTRSRRYREQSQDKIRNRHLIVKYGITLQDYSLMAANQNNACLICGEKPKAEKVLRVDHDHATGLVRGLLCDQCNTALGGFRDNEKALGAAIQYLQKGRKTMTDFTFADLKLGGRLTAGCEAISAGHLNRAAGIFAEIADDLNNEALTATGGLLAPDEDDWSAPLPDKPKPAPVSVPTADLQMCARGVHAFDQPDPVSGWRVCAGCGQVNITPPSDGPVDIAMRG